MNRYTLLLVVIHAVLLMTVALTIRSLNVDPVPFLIIAALIHVARTHELEVKLALQEVAFPPARAHLDEQMKLLQRAAELELPDEDHDFTPDLARKYMRDMQTLMRNVNWAYTQYKRPHPERS